MKEPGRRLRPQRIFSEEFRRMRVKEYERGEYSIKEIAKMYDISLQTVYTWIHKYSTYNKKGFKIVEMSESSEKKVKTLYDRIKELERIIGQKQLTIDYLEKLIEIASEEYEIDIKKNSATSPSNGLEKTGK
jgi:transposase